MPRMRWGFKPAAVLLGAMIPLVGLEGYFRIRGIGAGFYEPDPVLGARHIPNARGRWRQACFDVPIRINSHGFRDVEHLLEKPPGIQRIIVLGDSIAEALQVPLEGSFPRRLETLLNGGGGGPPAEVLNFGVSGYGTAQEYLSLKTRGAQYRPDAVVLVFTILNDVRNNSPALEGKVSSYPRPYFRLNPAGHLVAIPFEPIKPDTAGLLGKVKTALRHLNLYHVLVATVRAQPSLRSFFAGVGLLRDNAASPPAPEGAPTRATDPAYLDYEIYRREPDPEWREAWRTTEALLRAVRDEARRLGARFLLVAVPGAAEFAGHEEISKWFPAYMPSEYDLGAPRERLRRLAEEARMEYISLYEVFAEDLRSRRGTLTDLFWWCDGHLSPHGHEVVARSLAQHVGRPRGAATAR